MYIIFTGFTMGVRVLRLKTKKKAYPYCIIRDILQSAIMHTDFTTSNIVVVHTYEYIFLMFFARVIENPFRKAKKKYMYIYKQIKS